MGLSEDDEREYAELCARERELVQAPSVVVLNGIVIDLDADVEVGRQRQDR